MRIGQPVIISLEAFPEELQGQIMGLTFANDRGYIVIIDETRHPLRQRYALGHELAHIYLGHFDRDDIGWSPVASDPGKKTAESESLEHEANRNAWKYYRACKAGELEDVRILKRTTGHFLSTF